MEKKGNQSGKGKSSIPAKIEEKKAIAMDAIEGRIDRKYKIDYSSLSSLQQKKERGKRRGILRKNLNAIILADIAKDSAKLQSAMDSFRNFANDSYHSPSLENPSLFFNGRDQDFIDARDRGIAILKREKFQF